MQSPQITRRSIAAALFALPASTWLSQGAEAGMFPALNSVLIKDRVKWPESASLASETGWPGVDVDLNRAMQTGVDATNELLQRLRLRPGAINFPVKLEKDEATFQSGLETLKAQSKFAAQVHCPRMVTAVSASSHTPKSELRSLYKRRVTACAQVMASYGVRLGLEFLGPLQFRKQPYEFIWRMNDMLELATECGTNVGLLVDTWHWHHAGATTADIVKAGRDRIVHIHFNDAARQPPEEVRDDQRLLPGEGVINLTGFLQALRTIGYRDALSVEVFGRMDSQPPKRAAALGLAAANRVLTKAGILLT